MPGKQRSQGDRPDRGTEPGERRVQLRRESGGDHGDEVRIAVARDQHGTTQTVPIALHRVTEPRQRALDRQCIAELAYYSSKRGAHRGVARALPTRGFSAGPCETDATPVRVAVEAHW